MKKLFLTSYFAGTAHLFEQYFGSTEFEKKVVFIPTAANVDEYKKHLAKAQNKLSELGFAVEVLDVAAAPEREAREKIEQTNYLYIAGGNTFYLLQELKRKNLLDLITRRVSEGMIYIGESAGGMIASPNVEYVQPMDPKELAPELSSYEALKLVDFYLLPHAGEFPFAEAVEEIIDTYGAKCNFLAINNKQVIIVHGNEVNKL